MSDDKDSSLNDMMKDMMAEKNGVGLDPILKSSGIFAAIALVLFIAFSFLRRTDFGKAWYTPKRFVRPHQVPPALTFESLFGWSLELWQMKEETILQYGGYDVIMFLRVVRMFFWILVYFAPYGLFVIVPINISLAPSNSDDGDDIRRDGFIETTLSNLISFASDDDEEGRWELYVPHLVGAIYLQAIILYLTFNTHLEYIDLRLSYRRYNPYEKNTVLVVDIPETMRSAKKLEEYFNLCYDSVKPNSVTMLRKLNSLESLIERREGTILSLERQLVLKDSGSCGASDAKLNGLQEKLQKQNEEVASMQQKVKETDKKTDNDAKEELEEEISRENTRGRRLSVMQVLIKATGDTPSIRDIHSGAFAYKGKTRTSYSEYEDNAPKDSHSKPRYCHHPPVTSRALNFMISMQNDHDKEKKEDDDGIGDKAFVTFMTRKAATIAAQVVHSSRNYREVLSVSEAPGPDDIFWGNINKTYGQKQALSFLVEVILGFLNVFFIIPVTYLNLAFQDNAKPILGIPLASFLPLIIIIISNLLPPLMTGLGFLQGSMTWSLNGYRQLDRFTNFLLINVFLVALVVQNIEEFIEMYEENVIDYKEVMGSMARTVVDLSGFFVQYMAIKATASLGIELCRGLTVFHMISRWILRVPDTTKRERLRVVAGIRRYDNPGWLPFGKQYAHLILALTLCTSYAILSPLILVPGILYFGFAQLVYRYTLLYVYEPRFEVGGQFWPRVMKWIIRIMYMNQALMVCIFVLVGYLSGATLMIICFILTNYLYGAMVKKEDNFQSLPVEMAILMDEQDSQRVPTKKKPIFLKHVASHDALREMYIQPALIAKQISPDLPRDSRSTDNELSIGESQDNAEKGNGTIASSMWRTVSVSVPPVKKGAPVKKGVSFQDEL